MQYIQTYMLTCHKRNQISALKLEIQAPNAYVLARIIEEIFGKEDCYGIGLRSPKGQEYTAIVSARRRRPYNMLFLFKYSPGSMTQFSDFTSSDKFILDYAGKELMGGKIVEIESKRFVE